MRTRTRALLITVTLAALVAIAGCVDGGSSAPSSAPAPDALQEDATAAMQDVETARFTMDMNVDTSQGSVAMEASGVMDIPAKKMRMDLSMDLDGRSVEAVQYIVDQTAYQRVQGRWQTRDVGEQDLWSQGNQIALQQQMLEDATVEITGSDTVDGHDVWVVSIQPSDEAIQQLLGGTGAGVGENVEVEDLSFKQYVDVDSYHVRKLDLQMDSTMQGQDATVGMTMTFKEFDEPVDIQVPAEAR